ncbi:MAG: polyhydroxyalkanoic acid system family protein [Polyangiales bacterium]
MKRELSRPHALDLPTLRARITARVEHYTQRYPALNLAEHYRWVGEREARGSYRGGDGSLRLEERAVHLTLELPFFARPFRARIEEFLRREADQLVAA